MNEPFYLWSKHRFPEERDLLIQDVRRNMQQVDRMMLGLVVAAIIMVTILEIQSRMPEYLIALVIAIALTPICIVTMRVYGQRRIRLLEEGEALHGTLIDAAGKNERGVYTVTINYEFTSPTGTKMLDKLSYPRDDLRNKPLPEKGTPVPVVYLNDQRYMVL